LTPGKCEKTLKITRNGWALVFVGDNKVYQSGVLFQLPMSAATRYIFYSNGHSLTLLTAGSPFGKVMPACSQLAVAGKGEQTSTEI
jgi:hypothetical protein